MASPALSRPSSSKAKGELKYLENSEDPDLNQGSVQRNAMVAAISSGQAPYGVINVELPNNVFEGEREELSRSRGSVDPRLETSGSSLRAVSPKESGPLYRERHLIDRYNRQASTSPASRRSESPRARQADYGHERETLSVPSWMYDPALGGFNPLPKRAALHKHKRQQIKTDSGKRHTTAKAVLQVKQAMDMIQHEVNFPKRGAIAGWKLSPITSYHQNRAYGIWSQARSEMSSSRPTTTQPSQPRAASRERSLSAEASFEAIAKDAFGSHMTDVLGKRVFGEHGPLTPLHGPHMTMSGGHDTLSQITAHYPFPRNHSARGVTALKLSRPGTGSGSGAGTGTGTEGGTASLSTSLSASAPLPITMLRQTSFTGKNALLNFTTNATLRGQAPFAGSVHSADGADRVPFRARSAVWREQSPDPSGSDRRELEQPPASAHAAAAAGSQHVHLSGGISGSRQLSLHREDPRDRASLSSLSPPPLESGAEEPYLQWLRRRPASLQPMGARRASTRRDSGGSGHSGTPSIREKLGVGEERLPESEVGSLVLRSVERRERHRPTRTRR